jgi:DNA-binding beta-propeller fold protein YncE
VAIDRSGVIYVLQRGDKAAPVIAVDKQGKTIRSWGKGMFTVPHSVRVDADGNIWTVDAGSSTILKFTPQGKKLLEITVGEVAAGDRCAFPTLCGTTDIAFGPTGRLLFPMAMGTRASWNTRPPASA